LVRRLLAGHAGQPARVVVLSRDEGKQHDMRQTILGPPVASDDVIFEQRRARLAFRIGDVRDLQTMIEAVREADIIIHAAALKQVPTCEYFPREAVMTNVMGADALTRAVHTAGPHVEAVVGISTDKACKPVNVLGMTKALMERIFIAANLPAHRARFLCVRYGNVIGTRGSVFPLFERQAAAGGPVTVTSFEMTRFLLTLDRAIDVIFAALRDGRRGEILVPRAPAARVVDLARAVIGDRAIDVREVGIRPGEKIHEVMVSEEECARTSERNGFYAIAPMLPELRGDTLASAALRSEYSSAETTLDVDGVRALLSDAHAGVLASA
jgi:UDP-glucose 4-epimerase